MNIQKHKNEQGGFSEAWVGSVYIVYSMVGLTLGNYLGELTTAVLMTVVPIFIYAFYLGIEEERQKEQILKQLEAPVVPALEETDKFDRRLTDKAETLPRASYKNRARGRLRRLGAAAGVIQI